MNERWSTFDLVEGFHLAHAIAALHQEGVLQSLRQAQTVEQLVAQHPVDPAMLRAVLQYAAARTDLVEQRGAEFATTTHYEPKARFLIDQYIGTYGPHAQQLRALLRNPSLAPSLVDRSQHAQAYGHLDAPGLPTLPDVIMQLKLNHLLDLGCGPGSVLLTLAQKDQEFIGWGVDLNPWMCTNALDRVRSLGVDERIRIFEGDSTTLETVLAANIRDQVEAICAASLLNEFFGHGTSAVIAFLQKLRTLFPERLLLVVDYYGRLGHSDQSWPPHTLLHDFIQVISGQGVPPYDRSSWYEMYTAAGCRLIYSAEDENATCFIHLLRL